MRPWRSAGGLDPIQHRQGKDQGGEVGVLYVPRQPIHTMKPFTSPQLPPARGFATRREDRRGYETPIGTLPSVTTVIGATKSKRSKEALAAWKERDKDGSRQKAAQFRGNDLHLQAENWIQGLPTREHLIFGGYWRCLRGWLEENFHSALGIEFPIWHGEAGGFSGTVDCLGWTYDSCSLQLIDWKSRQGTSPLDPHSEMLAGGYFLQLAAYRAGILWTYGLEINDALLVVARPMGKANVFHLEKGQLDQYQEEFFHRLSLFHAEHHELA